MINSSRNQIGKSLHPVKSFAEISEPNEDADRSHKRRVSGQAIPVNHRISVQSQIYATQMEGVERYDRFDKIRDISDFEGVV